MSIGEEAFKNCTNLVTVAFQNIINVYRSAFRGCDILSVFEPSSLAKAYFIQEYAFADCRTLRGEFTFANLTTVGEAAFYGTGITSVSFYESTQRIIFGTMVFQNCSELRTLIFPTNQNIIPEAMCVACSSLQSITIPESVILINPDAFRACTALVSVTLPSTTLTTIPLYGFAECTSLANITIPESVRVIGDGAFQDCTSLTNITIPRNVEIIGSTAFRGCSLITVHIGVPSRSLIRIDETAFEGASGPLTFVVGVWTNLPIGGLTNIVPANVATDCVLEVNDSLVVTAVVGVPIAIVIPSEITGIDCVSNH
jgi:hypothetical protein